MTERVSRVKLLHVHKTALRSQDEEYSNRTLATVDIRYQSMLIVRSCGIHQHIITHRADSNSRVLVFVVVSLRYGHSLLH